ncbi:carbon-nitrogen hydrolase family protein [Marinobacterium rhizophilum]|uniref:Carbon-nitrogen hydrolase family protein n=1 Tax=Marinobacterium rhizophilum TaxID=420402 RepID=A0ABY5HNL8_9GAMM|nr:carbon-nitrogen hydrolase family protein [Marinobacterium rhizophilum]UTW14010.1 carbon-nitrogen hydrolase family protein [Marinobacterium rhizophilum]
MSKCAVIQMVSGPGFEANFATAQRLVQGAAAEGARLVVLPENFALFDSANLRTLAQQQGRGELQQRLGALAADAGIWLVAGSVPLVQRENGSELSGGRVRSACLVFDDRGQQRARYDKRHLFDVDVADAQKSYRESDYIEPGEQVVLVDTPCGRLGLSICYDLRFADHYQRLRDAGAELISVPSAFTAVTGQAHWELLLRARAVEFQCYLLGANQGGQHGNGRETWGHSMVVDPWGRVAGSLAQGEGWCCVDIDLAELKRIRQRMPVSEHRHRAVIGR